MDKIKYIQSDLITATSISIEGFFFFFSKMRTRTKMADAYQEYNIRIWKKKKDNVNAFLYLPTYLLYFT